MEIDYSITTQYADASGNTQHIIDDELSPKPKKEQVKPWYHVNPISTQIDLDSVVGQLNNDPLNPGMNVTKDMLLNPPYYEFKPNRAKIK